MCLYSHSKRFSTYYDSISKFSSNELYLDVSEKKYFKTIHKSVLNRWMKEMIDRETVLQKKMDDFLKKKQKLIKERKKFEEEKISFTLFFHIKIFFGYFNHDEKSICHFFHIFSWIFLVLYISRLTSIIIYYVN